MERVFKGIFYLSMAFIIYMPLHVFIAQSASLVTGGLDVWKAAKDVILVLLVPFLLYLSYVQALFRNRTFRWIIIIGAIYTLIHLLYVLYDQNDDTYSAIVGSVYNTRLLGYLLLGYVLGSSINGAKYLKYMLTAMLLIATAVSLFGVLQYFLPSDLLENVGYTIDRGVKPLFFIDDKPDFPRIMSTLKDPNSLGAYLIVPILLASLSLFKKTINGRLFIRPFRSSFLLISLTIQLLALFFTFSRGALIGLLASLIVLVLVITKEINLRLLKKWWPVLLVTIATLSLGLFISRNSYIVQNIIFHADESTAEADPNEKRVALLQESIEAVADQPLGYGPGTAGLVSIKNPKGGVLTENYYLQIAYEFGWLGITLFLAIITLISYRLLQIIRNKDYLQIRYAGSILLASLVGYLFYSLLVHLWSNEAIALQWWLLTGTVLGLGITTKSGSRPIHHQ